MMKALTIFALGFLAVVSAKKYFYDTPGLHNAEGNGRGGALLRSLSELREYLGLGDEFSFKVEGSRKASTGVRRVRLRQMFKGLPIRVATLQASQNEYGYYTGSVSGFCPTISDSLDISVTNSKNDLMSALVSYMNANDPEIPGTQLGVDELENFRWEKQIHIDTDTGNADVVYFVSALVERGLDDGAYIRYPRLLFKAGSLEVVYAELPVQKEGMHRSANSCPKIKGGNRKSCRIDYGPRPNQVCLNAMHMGGRCVLSNSRVSVKTVKNSWKRSEAEIVAFDCDEFHDDGKNGAYSPAADAFHFSQVFCDVLQKWGGLECDRLGPHTLYVHFGDKYPNSFWDGRSTTFGDGSGMLHPFATAEVVGHEMCHAVTEAFGNLVFDSEAESVGEAFSDICGKAVNYYVNGQSAGWGLASGLLKDPHQSLRYFDHPSRDGSSLESFNEYVAGTNKYAANGIMLKAFYSIVNEQFVSFHDAYEAFVFANQIYWNEETGFVDAACGVVRSARDLGLDTEAFAQGFQAVDISLNHRICSLQGTEDHISYCSFNDAGEFRHARISSSRRATYHIRPAYRGRRIQVNILCADSHGVTIESQRGYGYNYISNRQSGIFSIGHGATIVIMTESPDLIDVTVQFQYV